MRVIISLIAYVLCSLTLLSICEAAPKIVDKDQDPLVELDGNITKNLAKLFESDANFDTKPLERLIAKRRELCQKPSPACLDASSWAKWTCLNNTVHSRNFAYSLWETATQSARSPDQGLKLWAQLKSCNPDPKLLQYFLSFKLLQVATEKDWVSLKKEILKWQGLSSSASIESFLLSAGDEGSALAGQTLGDIFENLMKWHPISSDQCQHLADLTGGWLKTKPKLKIEDTIFVGAYVMEMWSAFGYRSKVVPFFEFLRALDAPEKFDKRPVVKDWIFHNYCQAVKDLGRLRLCDELGMKVDPVKESSYAFQSIASWIENENNPQAPQKLSELRIKLRGANPPSPLWPWYLFLQSELDYDLGNFPKAQAALATFFTELGSRGTVLQKLHGQILGFKIQAGLGNFVQARREIDQVKTILRRDVRGRNWHSMFADFSALVVAMKARDKSWAAKELENLKTNLISDPSQKFFEVAAEAAGLKLEGKDVTATLEKMAKLRGKEDFQFRDFVRALSALSKRGE